MRTQGVGECLPWEREQKGKATYHLSDHVIDAEHLTCLFDLYIHQHNTIRHYHPRVDDQPTERQVRIQLKDHIDRSRKKRGEKGQWAGREVEGLEHTSAAPAPLHQPWLPPQAPFQAQLSLSKEISFPKLPPQRAFSTLPGEV